MSRVDQKNVFHDDQLVAASGNNYGTLTVELPKDQDKSGFSSLELVVKGNFTAGTVTINLVGGDTANPTVVTQPIYTGLAADLNEKQTLRVGITPGALKEFNRVNVSNSAANAGAKILSYLV